MKLDICTQLEKEGKKGSSVNIFDLVRKSKLARRRAAEEGGTKKEGKKDV